MSLSAKMIWDVPPVKAFDTLSRGLKNKGMRIAINAGSSPVKAEVITEAPSNKGKLKKSYRIKVKNYKNSSIWTGVIGSKGALLIKKGYPSNLNWLQDQGSKFIRGKHFMTASLNAEREAFYSNVCRKLNEFMASFKA